MNRRTKTMLGLGFAALLAFPAFAQDNSKNPAPEGGAAQAGKLSTSQAGKSAATTKNLDVLVKFDVESAKGEILCKEGREKGNKIEYAKCAKNNLNKYGEIAVMRGIVASEANYSKLSKAQQNTAKKVAFFGSARKALKEKMLESRQDKALGGAVEYKKFEGAYNRVNKEYMKALSACAKTGSALKCPPGDDNSVKAAPAAKQLN